MPPLLPLTRRSLIATGVGAITASAAPPVAALPAGLAMRARPAGLLFGSAMNHAALGGPAGLLLRFAAECDAMTPEYAMKWAAIQPAEGVFDFTAADAALAWAARHRLQLRGHTLVWHESNPAWLDAALTATPARAETLLRAHVAAVAGRYRGRVAHWDVVNEPVQPDDRQPGGLRASAWLRALGPRYIDVAFQACAAADPGALRVLNEFGTDYTLPWQETKRRAVLALATDLVRRGVPIQAIGLQAHLDAAEVTLDQRILSGFVAEIAALGLRVIVTELDVRDERLPAYVPARDGAIAAHARAWLDAVLPNAAVGGVLTWGLTQRASWLNSHYPRPDRLDQRGLPLDTDLARTPLYDAIGACLAAAAPRRPLPAVLATVPPADGGRAAPKPAARTPPTG